ncbi:uncharacterized protein LOC112966099 isoform X5 [Apteryx rowi]|uniref:uncharacterized protein LOC112966099 isoform X5 n=1 Tax=Apteryx rowi TaxID=308060 RepID=UPI000E1CD430|nr:uncharacterized protein LOC112966099 isoform X5 [Apteryx rowi]
MKLVRPVKNCPLICRKSLLKDVRWPDPHRQTVCRDPCPQLFAPLEWVRGRVAAPTGTSCLACGCLPGSCSQHPCWEINPPPLMNPIVKCTSPAAEKTSIIQITLCCEAENVTKHGNIPKGCPLCASDEVKSATIAKRRLDAHLYHQKRKPECGAPPVQIPRDLPLLTRFLPEVHTYHVTGERFAVATAFRGTEGLQTRE